MLWSRTFFYWIRTKIRQIIDVRHFLVFENGRNSMEIFSCTFFNFLTLKPYESSVAAITCIWHMKGRSASQVVSSHSCRLSLITDLTHLHTINAPSGSYWHENLKPSIAIRWDIFTYTSNLVPGVSFLILRGRSTGIWLVQGPVTE